MGEKRNVYRLLVGKPEGKRPLGRPRRRWIENINGWCEDGNESSYFRNAWKYLRRQAADGFCRRALLQDDS
jgi:hypothetical protein